MRLVISQDYRPTAGQFRRFVTNVAKREPQQRVGYTNYYESDSLHVARYTCRQCLMNALTAMYFSTYF